MDSSADAFASHQTVTWTAPTPSCPVEVALSAISGRWATLVLRDLMFGPRLFGELRAGLPTLSAKVLTERLTSLRRQEIVAVVDGSYQLTSRGLSLRPLLVELFRTGEALQGATPRS
ncbi:MAG: helix-turn-helix transcriptional regulator [Pseudonocardiaceae bacterium]|nr:helix-turn-helix transcriptional regulator [Pseudonocardiaceae bacterium]